MVGSSSSRSSSSSSITNCGGSQTCSTRSSNNISRGNSRHNRGSSYGANNCASMIGISSCHCTHDHIMDSHGSY